jgi:hypothetical protein
MSLIKKPAKTEKQLAANRRNQKPCNVPVTDERREHIHTALRRFGYNLPAEEMAMRALGEDPADFQELLEALWEEWNPVGALQEGLVIGLEGYAVRQAQEVSGGRQDRVHARMMRLKMTEERLKRLAASVAREHYVTSREDLEKMKSLHEDGALKEMGENALALFYQLQAPGTGEDGIDPNEQAQRALMRIKEIFGLTPDCAPPPVPGAPGYRPPQENQPDAQGGFASDISPAPFNLPSMPEQVPVGPTPLEENDQPYPNITPAEWEAREQPRQLLENILTRYVESCEAQRKVLLKESIKGPSPYERAAEIAPTHPDARAMRRMQDTNLREVRRITNLLLKIKRYERQTKVLEKTRLSIMYQKQKRLAV